MYFFRLKTDFTKRQFADSFLSIFKKRP